MLMRRKTHTIFDRKIKSTFATDIISSNHNPSTCSALAGPIFSVKLLYAW